MNVMTRSKKQARHSQETLGYTTNETTQCLVKLECVEQWSALCDEEYLNLACLIL